jgi:hypothetical protein
MSNDKAAATWSSDSDEPIPSTGVPLVAPATPGEPVNVADVDPDREFSPAPSLTEVQPDEDSEAELPDGDQHADELSNTDPDNHGADTSAPTHEDAPQAYGWDESSLTETAGPEDETSGEPLISAPDDVPGTDDSAPVSDDPQASRSGTPTKRAASKRTSKRASKSK